MKVYYAHSAQGQLCNLLPYERWQTLQSHAQNVGNSAANFAQVFGAQDIAYHTGQLHDLGKYSLEFQARLNSGSRPVDHSTAGAKIAVERWGSIAIMRAKHRTQKLDEIRGRLKNGDPCRVIATSLIEAGVDVDFPLVMRAEAGLDSVAQAAGRCNREGKRPSENRSVWIFAPEAQWKAPSELTA